MWIWITKYPDDILTPMQLFLLDSKIVPNSPPADFLSGPMARFHFQPLLWQISSQQRGRKEVAVEQQTAPQYQHWQFNNKVHNSALAKQIVCLYFWCVVADSFLRPTPSAPHLDKLIRNNPRHSHIWHRGTLTLAPLPNHHKNPLLVSFPCVLKPFFNHLGSLSCSAQKTSFKWVINLLIPS